MFIWKKGNSGLSLNSIHLLVFVKEAVRFYFTAEFNFCIYDAQNSSLNDIKFLRAILHLGYIN